MGAIDGSVTKLFFTRAMLAGTGPSYNTFAVDSAVWLALGQTEMRIDFSVVPWTHFRIHGYLDVSEAGETVSLQLAEVSAPDAALSGAGPDLVVDDAAGWGDSGWIAISPAITTDKQLTVAMLGSTATVDLLHYGLYISFKYDP